MIYSQHFIQDIQGWADDEFHNVMVFQGDEDVLTRIYIITDSGNKTDTGVLRIRIRQLGTDGVGDEEVFSQDYDIAGLPERWFIIAEVNTTVRLEGPLVLELGSSGIPTTNTQLIFITAQFERAGMDYKRVSALADQVSSTAEDIFNAKRIQ
jgi:hypothetical protein